MSIIVESKDIEEGVSLPIKDLMAQPGALPVMPPEPIKLPVEDLEEKKLPVWPEEAPQPMLADDYHYADSVLEGDGEVTIQVDDEDPETKQFSFTLPLVPGGEYQEDIEEPSEIEVEEDDEIVVNDDPWNWGAPSNFLSWLCNKMNVVPNHSGRDSAGLERAISYLEAIDREISKAVRSDLNNDIDISEVETARDELHKGLERLQERLDKVVSSKYPGRKKKRKKKAEENSNLVKEAKSAHVGNIMVTVPLLISSIVRTCINSMVSAGKDIESCFDKLAQKYELTPREEMEAIQLFADMGYAIRRPRGYHRDEEIDYTSTDNFDYIAQYSS